MTTLKYAWLAIKHKWFVLLAGRKTGACLWDLLIHDLSKFRPSELPHYGRQFFGAADDPEGFIRCWLRHQNRNKHHWEYWIPRTGHNRCDPPYADNEPIPMPMRYVREMIADWMGAGRAYEGRWPNWNSWAWFQKNVGRMRLHDDTWARIQKVIEHQTPGG